MSNPTVSRRDWRGSSGGISLWRRGGEWQMARKGVKTVVNQALVENPSRQIFLDKKMIIIKSSEILFSWANCCTERRLCFKEGTCKMCLRRKEEWGVWMEEELLTEIESFMSFPTTTTFIPGYSDLRDKFERSLVIWWVAPVSAIHWSIMSENCATIVANLHRGCLPYKHNSYAGRSREQYAPVWWIFEGWF